MQFTLVLNELVQKCGLSSFAAGAELSLMFDGQHTVTFLSDASDRSAIFFAEICDVAAVKQDELLELLHVSLLGSQTGGASFAVDRKLGKLILWKRHDDDFQDVAALEWAINAFLAALITWKSRLSESQTFSATASCPALKLGEGQLRA